MGGMQIRLVGTGSADGWPNPFCTCDSCTAQERAGIRREPTCALVDDLLLLDCGPQTPARARAQGGDPTRVEHVVVTHDHPDHSSPMALLSHGWSRKAGGTAPDLQVWGPADVIDRWSHWCGPDDPATFHPISPGETHLLSTAAGGYTLRVLAAHHATALGHGVLLDLTGPTGHRVLYATDTGPLPQDTRAGLAGSRFDVVALELTFGPWTGHATQHLDLEAFTVELAWMREAGVVDAGTRVVPVHLSHHNPPEEQLERLLSPLGVSAARDGDLIEAGAPAARSLLVTGGVRSGKSRHAEQTAIRWSRSINPARLPCYVATGPRPEQEDDAWAARVAAHRERRVGRFDTVETGDATTVLAESGPDEVVLVDCLGTWLTAQLDAVGAWADEPGWAAALEERVDAFVAAVRDTPASVVVVTNEVGSGVVPPTPAGRMFADWLGGLNARVGQVCDGVVLMVAGRPLELPRGA